jgi:hypothetical protein
MNTQEHLQKIKAKCQELLAIAEKRTAGRWAAATESVWAKDEGYEKVCDMLSEGDPDFIASCAGAAEAGWRATIAAIDGIIDPESTETTHSWSIQYNAATVACICEAWPEELL